MTIKKETHLIVLWSEAIFLKEKVINHLDANFSIRRIFNVNWDKDCFDDNLKVFYAHSQKHLSKEEYRRLLASKKKHCGSDTFCAIVFDDLTPLYQDRNTTDGIRPVNTRIFDLKQELRAQSGGGHKIHATDNTFESNKDLTLLLGKNLHDFEAAYPGTDTTEITWNKNCLGVGGYNHISDLFYVLNNTISYVVMRNFEPLPNAYTLEGHGDIDLLVESLNYVVYLTDAQPVFPEFDYRVHYRIPIDGQMIPFDFRFLGDDYYDLKWQKNMLDTKTVYNGIVQVPNAGQYFYSLVYHAYIHKREVSDDYKRRLEKMGKDLGVDFNANTSPAAALQILNAFMAKSGYSYTIPIDESVFYNKLFLNQSDQTLHKYGRRIGQSQCRYENRSFISQVFEKDGVITKSASAIIIQNEVEYLGRLSDFEFFPKLLHYEIDGDYGMVQMEKIEGESFEDVVKQRSFWRKKNLSHLFSDALEVLKILIQNDIQHRDIRPDNIILVREKDYYRLRLIDFGWAANIVNNQNTITPRSLGSAYRYGHNAFSDAYSMGRTINFNFLALPFYRSVYNNLIAITPEDYRHPEVVLEKLNQLQNQLNAKRMSLKEHLKLFYYRSPFLMEMKKRVFNTIKK